MADLKISQETIAMVVAALSRAISLALVKEPSLHAGFMEAAMKLDDEIAYQEADNG